jgi:UDP-N-acetylmuramoyl-tripeptide--D-alanyl-D-alanine ligase
MEFTLKEIVDITKGELVQGGPSTLVKGISTDSRTLNPGEGFLTLVGERFDGSQFIAQALSKGAAGIITHSDPASITLPETVWLVRVPDALTALGDLAAAWRQRFTLPVVAISGSGGKTTTKEIIAHALSNERVALITEKNYNNLIGVPLTLLQLNSTHECAVLEIGMNAPGELARLTQISAPQIAALTNIGTAHIGQLGSEDALIQAKAEMFTSLGADALIIINSDCGLTKKMLARIEAPQRRKTFGLAHGADVMARRIVPLAPYGYAMALDVQGELAHVEFRTFGKYNVYNALCAACILAELGMPVRAIAQYLSSFRASGMRSEIVQVNGITIIKDCYNANPSSVIQTLESLDDFQIKGESYVLLGDMLELGEHSAGYHRDVGRAFKQYPVTKVFTIGELGQIISNTAQKYGQVAIHFASKSEAISTLGELLRPGDVLLIKGSRLMELEEVAEKLVAILDARGSTVLNPYMRR